MVASTSGAQLEVTTASDDLGATTGAPDPQDDGGAIDSLAIMATPFLQARIVADRHYRHGMDLEGRGLWERALRHYRTACDLHPQKPLYLLARGRVSQEHGLLDEAAACYALVRKADPKDPVALFNQATLHARTGDLAAAAANLQAILDAAPGPSGARAVATWRLLGDVELARRDAHAAVVAYGRARALDPDDAFLEAIAIAADRIRDLVADPDVRIAFGPDGLALPPKATAYAFVGAMVLGLPEDDGIDVPAYPPLGFISVEEVAQALARVVAILRRRRPPVTSVVAVEDAAGPVAHALGNVLEASPVPRAGSEAAGTTVYVSIDGDQPEALRVAAGADPGAWVLCLGLRHPALRYAGTVDAVLITSPAEVPWATSDPRASRPDGDPATALADALARVAPDYAAADRVLAWHLRHPRLRRGDLAASFPPPSCSG